ncbi:YihY/virulence factor BrkB family protein [Pontibacter akesuensis]|uniref:Membrane protein n=1 Tax=Pontibacter akesuensis TaxID=388950 RepID=A0A1I7KSY4_9BACT|nr:YihY/virulence factor BrkB family protein [Pontibacter akesuensis]GHA80847.1 ribonuclease [Pontibacter akesuensis]SFV00515.1 membrane protein [Pontibacter akesuensis]
MEDAKGRNAEAPKEIPAAGWKQVMLRVKEQLATDNISIVAAGVAFYFFLALFPTLAAIISIYGLVTSPAEVEQQMEQLTSVLPPEAHDMLTERLRNIAQQSSSSLGWGALLGIVLSLWSANSGTKSLFEGINIAYDEENDRSFLKLNAITLLFTLGGIILGSLCVALVVAFPAIIEHLGLPDWLETVLQLGRWVLLIVFIMGALALIYKVAPKRNNPKFRWVSWGSAMATGLWLLGSLLFSYYVNNFGNYSETYGSVAAVIILMLWFNLTSFIILLGAEINSELEHQTAKDTTVGKEKPLGERNAYHADHVAGDPGDEQKSEK